MISYDLISMPCLLSLPYLYFLQNARENNIVNPKMVVKFTILVPYSKYTFIFKYQFDILRTPETLKSFSSFPLQILQW